MLNVAAVALAVVENRSLLAIEADLLVLRAAEAVAAAVGLVGDALLHVLAHVVPVKALRAGLLLCIVDLAQLNAILRSEAVLVNVVVRLALGALLVPPPVVQAVVGVLPADRGVGVVALQAGIAVAHVAVVPRHRRLAVFDDVAAEVTLARSVEPRELPALDKTPSAYSLHQSTPFFWHDLVSGSKTRPMKQPAHSPLTTVWHMS